MFDGDDKENIVPSNAVEGENDEDKSYVKAVKAVDDKNRVYGNVLGGTWTNPK